MASSCWRRSEGDENVGKNDLDTNSGWLTQTCVDGCLSASRKWARARTHKKSKNTPFLAIMACAFSSTSSRTPAMPCSQGRGRDLIKNMCQNLSRRMQNQHKALPGTALGLRANELRQFITLAVCVCVVFLKGLWAFYDLIVQV